MPFIDHETTREAQRVRKNRERYDTPDRPGTALGYSVTGKRPDEHRGKPQTALGQALADAGIKPEPRKRSKSPKRQKPAQGTRAPRVIVDEPTGADLTARKAEAAAALRRMAAKR